tara:strand:- start:99 stop:689 length:591 start_codon:yes stop_codon:yes gene_type:complete
MDKYKKIIIATHNSDKRIEMESYLRDYDVNILSLADFPNIGEIEETGNSLKENAFIKASEVFNITKIPTIADDTGLEVDALNGKPGVFSARYAGEKATYTDNVNLLLNNLKGVNKDGRTARFRTVISFVASGCEYYSEGTVNGKITERISGTDGFGYDSVFMMDESDKTFGEITKKEKLKVSHRSLALQKIVKIIF